MNKTLTTPSYINILNVLYIIISLVVMSIYLFTSTPSLDEYIGIFSVAAWGTILAALVAVVLASTAMLQSKR